MFQLTVLTFSFHDRMGHEAYLDPHEGDTIGSILLRHRIPATSVLVTRGGFPLPDCHALQDGGRYEARLIEGYDIESIRALYPGPREHHEDVVYEKSRVGFTVEGALEHASSLVDRSGIVRLVEDTVASTVEYFNLIPSGSIVTIGLSGGVDSSGLLIALGELRRARGDFEIAAATFEDYDSHRSPTFEHAAELTSQYDIRHVVVPGADAETVFNLAIPFSGALLSLMETEEAHHAMYVDHHVTRRMLEVFSEREGAATLALGLHVTDLLAGLLNGLAIGYEVGTLPKRSLPNITYVYPLAFVPKRELHLYHLAKTGHLARHTRPNQWELNPKDRNFYYYLADALQVSWPGVEAWVLRAHQTLAAGRPPAEYEICANCEAAVRKQASSALTDGLCDVCGLLARHGLLAGSPPPRVTAST